MESFFHTLKGDIIRKNSFKSEKHLRDKLADYIQHFITVINCTQVLDIEPRMNMK
ncbi:IS3 family transposase [Vibrio tasmaniensis]|uniref:IS3 family transposase n=1 Tax=Vibrio tasmaniensis TaxID=212663 RepID=UPI0009BD2F4B